ncbi:MAG: hypothetical protein IPH06_09375 [Alphaproteobacteria bacterium]|nr:hypothetical protein [Alphaproteobacteria bacterium]QQS58205.1 MAG: hypothetical protein IPN28_05135 [Alphaproteobacteria bacterium]
MSEVRKELRNLFNTDKEQDVLRTLFMRSQGLSVSEDETLEVEEQPWVRGGGETYIMPFSVKNSSGQSVRCLFKACVTMLPDLKVTEWMQRREALATKGVESPHVFGHGNGVVLEEFVPYTLEEGYQRFGGEVVAKAARAFGGIASLGFHPVSGGILRDFRVDDQKRVLMIDFGSDLGAPGLEPSELWQAFVNDAKAQLKLDESEIEAYRSDYEAGLHMTVH